LLDLLDLKTGVTLVVVEMGIAIWAWWLNEQSASRRIEQEEERKQKEKLYQEKNKEIEDEKEKKRIIASLLLEIEANQTILQPIYDITEALENKIKPTNDKLPEGLYFKKDSFSSEFGRAGFLDKGIRDKLAQFYLFKLKYIEKEYIKFDINGKSYDYLNYRKLREFGQTKKYKPGWCETEKFLQYSKEAYDLGEELIKRF
jgi:hypothetical protein